MWLLVLKKSDTTQADLSIKPVKHKPEEWQQLGRLSMVSLALGLDIMNQIYTAISLPYPNSPTDALSNAVSV